MFNIYYCINKLKYLVYLQILHLYLLVNFLAITQYTIITLLLTNKIIIALNLTNPKDNFSNSTPC